MLKGKLLIGFVMLSFPLVITAAGPADSKKVVTLAAQQYCPFVCSPSGDGAEWYGVHVDILKRLFANSDYQLVFEKASFARSLRDAESGKIDGVLAILRNPRRERYLFYGTPITTTRSCFYVRSETSWQYTGVASLNEIALGIVQGYIYMGEVGAYFSQPEASPFIISGDDAETRQFNLLVAGRFDSLNENEAVADYHIKTLGLSNDIKKANCQAGKEANYLGVSKKSIQGEKFHQEFLLRINSPTYTEAIENVLSHYGISNVIIAKQ